MDSKRQKCIRMTVLGAALILTACGASAASAETNTDSMTTAPSASSTASAVSGGSNTTDSSETVIYRLYNPNTGEHFYTTGQYERIHLMTVGWNYEGIGWVAPKTSKTPVYRLYNPNAGDHHYTTSVGERKSLAAAGWKDEGICWYSDDAKSVPLYRQYNPNAKTGAHNFTTSVGEGRSLVSSGWKDEGTAWYAKAQTKVEWTVTSFRGQHPTEHQGMFYTIEDNKGRLVIVDGGWGYDADFVRKMIRAHHGDVSAWIITHAHPDHVGAFNTIMSGDHRDIEVEHLYTPKVNEARLLATAKAYDDIDYYKTFARLTASMPQLQYMKEGDTADLLGLQMRVIHSWDEEIDKLSSNMLNNGSLMFMLSGKNTKMLFCGDSQTVAENAVLSRYGAADLAADYVQCGHHGNWGLSAAFYDLVNPRVAFMDGPASITDVEGGRYDGYRLEKYFRDKGVTVYTWNAPWHNVVLE